MRRGSAIASTDAAPQSVVVRVARIELATVVPVTLVELDGFGQQFQLVAQNIEQIGWILLCLGLYALTLDHVHQ